MITRKTTRIVTGALAAVLGAMTWAAVGHAAGPVLIAIGTISGFYEDFATQTAAPLENGVRGNRLGGIGIGHRLSRRRLLRRAARSRAERRGVQPVRTDDTRVVHQPLSYRAHESVAERSRFAPLPFTLTPMVVDTTLLSSRTPLVYGSGCGLGGERRAGAQRVDHTLLFHRTVGQLRSDRSCRPTRRRTVRSGRHPRLQRSARASTSRTSTARTSTNSIDSSGRRSARSRCRRNSPISNLNSVGATLEISREHVTVVVTNKGMEGLAITPDGRDAGRRHAEPARPGRRRREGRQSHGSSRSTSRRARPASTPTNWTRASKTTISEIVAVNNHEFLVDERDSKGLGDDSHAAFKRLYRIDLAGASSTSATSAGPPIWRPTPCPSIARSWTSPPC